MKITDLTCSELAQWADDIGAPVGVLPFFLTGQQAALIECALFSAIDAAPGVPKYADALDYFTAQVRSYVTSVHDDD